MLSTLRDSPVPVPTPLLYSTERQVVGTPGLPDGKASTAGSSTASRCRACPPRSVMYESMGVTMAALHGVGFGAVGHADYGRPGNYFARQLDR